MREGHTIFIALTLGFALAYAPACGEDDDGIDFVSQEEIDDSCDAYCAQANVCDDEVVVQECFADCVDAMGNCMADELGATIDDLSICANEGCDDFTICTIGAGLQCRFGID